MASCSPAGLELALYPGMTLNSHLYLQSPGIAGRCHHAQLSPEPLYGEPSALWRLNLISAPLKKEREKEDCDFQLQVMCSVLEGEP